MKTTLHPLTLFRLTVLGPLLSRAEFKHGELYALVRKLAAEPYTIPGSRRSHLSTETIIRWYYLWKKGGVDALDPKPRKDKGKTGLLPYVQSTLVQCKKDNPARSINTVIAMVEHQGLVCKGSVARSTVHRFLQKEQLSKRILADPQTIERRSFTSVHAGDLWQGDVLHGPRISTPQGMRKTYLVTLMDDASRLIVHSAFCLGENALDIEGVLKQALLKRGLPRCLLIDNGAAYRSKSLQAICARLDIRLIYCRPYEPEAKGKLERFHRTFRAQFLAEINLEALRGIEDLNARLWAWLERVYHTRKHKGLQGKSPLERWREDLLQVRPLTPAIASRIDDLFTHSVLRTVAKDGTLRWKGQRWEVDYDLVGKEIVLVVDPHTNKPLRVESKIGELLGSVVLSDAAANAHRKRTRPATPLPSVKQKRYAVEVVYDDYAQSIQLLRTQPSEEK